MLADVVRSILQFFNHNALLQIRGHTLSVHLLRRTICWLKMVEKQASFKILKVNAPQVEGFSVLFVDCKNIMLHKLH